MKSTHWALVFCVACSLAACSQTPTRKTYGEAPKEASVPVANAPSPGQHPSEFHNLKGLAALERKDYPQAELDFKTALMLNPVPTHEGYFKYNLATASYYNNKPQVALDTLNEIRIQEVDELHRTKINLLKEKAVEKLRTVPAAEVPLAESLPTTEVGVTAAPNTDTGTDTETVAPDRFIPPPSGSYDGDVSPKRIGLLLPLTGRYASFGKRVQRSVELAFLNSTQPNAQSFEIITADTGATISSRLKALQKLVEDDQVIAIIGPILSRGLETLAARAAYYRVPLISIAQVQSTTSSHLYSCSISNQDQARKIIDYAMKVKNYRRFAILAPANNPGEEMAHAFWDELSTQGGEVTAFEFYDPAIHDFREPVDKTLGLHYQEARADEIEAMAQERKALNITTKTMKTAKYFSLPPIVNFDAVFIADEAKTAGQIIPTFAYRDAKGLSFLGMTSWNSNQLLQRAADQVEGAVFPVSFNTLSPSPSTKRFYDLYLNTYSAYPGELDALAFDSAELLLQALKDEPSSRSNLKDALDESPGVQAATGFVGIQNQRCVRDLNLYEVTKGKFENVKQKP